jgi:hypothetical protein
MGMDPKDFEKLVAHLEKQGKWMLDRSCPVCGTEDWSGHGPVNMLAPSAQVVQGGWGRMRITGDAFPVVALICKRCFFTRQFAWKPISGEGDV